jgi:hypothetical protein
MRRSLITFFVLSVTLRSAIGNESVMNQTLDIHMERNAQPRTKCTVNETADRPVFLFDGDVTPVVIRLFWQLGVREAMEEEQI